MTALTALKDVKRRAMERPALRWLKVIKRRLARRSEGEALLLERFKADHGYDLDLTSPRTFTEKMFCRMVRWNRHIEPRFTRLADKVAVRSFVTSRIGAQYLVPLLWHGKNPRRIPFPQLPARYVVKPSHGSGSVIIAKGDIEPAEVVRRASGWLKTNLYWVCREAQYYRIPPRVIVEEYLANADGTEALLYKFWCFDGVPRLVSVGDMAQTRYSFYDTAWNHLDFTHTPARMARPHVDQPKGFDHMVDVASRLSDGLDFVRVDLYNVAGKPYFSELTLTPSAGWFRFDPPEWDAKLGDLWTLRD